MIKEITEEQPMSLAGEKIWRSSNESSKWEERSAKSNSHEHAHFRKDGHKLLKNAVAWLDSQDVFANVPAEVAASLNEYEVAALVILHQLPEVAEIIGLTQQQIAQFAEQPQQYLSLNSSERYNTIEKLSMLLGSSFRECLKFLEQIRLGQRKVAPEQYQNLLDFYNVTQEKLTWQAASTFLVTELFKLDGYDDPNQEILDVQKRDEIFQVIRDLNRMIELYTMTDRRESVKIYSFAGLNRILTATKTIQDGMSMLSLGDTLGLPLDSGISRHMLKMLTDDMHDEVSLKRAIEMSDLFLNVPRNIRVFSEEGQREYESYLHRYLLTLIDYFAWREAGKPIDPNKLLNRASAYDELNSQDPYQVAALKLLLILLERIQVNDYDQIQGDEESMKVQHLLKTLFRKTESDENGLLPYIQLFARGYEFFTNTYQWNLDQMISVLYHEYHAFNRDFFYQLAELSTAVETSDFEVVITEEAMEAAVNQAWPNSHPQRR